MKPITAMLLGGGCALVGFISAVIPIKSAQVETHIDKERNVICYTYREAMECFTYVDQGTHLELMPKDMAL